jgi:hypothetical protein
MLPKQNTVAVVAGAVAVVGAVGKVAIDGASSFITQYGKNAANNLNGNKNGCNKNTTLLGLSEEMLD